MDIKPNSVIHLEPGDTLSETTSLIPAKISKDFFTITPRALFAKKKPPTQCQRLVRLLFVTNSAGSVFFDEKLIKRTASF